jgi:peptidoglycan hydrolase-like protein with peptidoglycan-binding domain
MADPWVTNTQNWLNDTYGAVSGWKPVVVTGQTGWSTMYALTRALQYELGIATLSDTFGPTTISKLNGVGDIGSGTASDATATSKVRSVANVYNIIRGALFCKGYNGGNGVLDGTWSSLTTSAVQTIRQDIGLAAGSGVVSAKLFKALLTMDAYVLVSGGSTQIRAIQRDLNSRYLARTDFYILPTDGFFSRSVQSALIYAIQYEEGLADGVANGTFGPTTQSNLKTQAVLSEGSVDSSKWFVHLFQAALTFNGYPVAYSGTFDAATALATRAFQAFCALNITSRADFATWAELLVSTGDTSRATLAVDTATPITAARAATLVGTGYTTVGRYLTNRPNVTDPLNKKIQDGELAVIFGAGLRVFPIFQAGGDSLPYFSSAQGEADAATAYSAARAFGFKRGTTIYFAVDFDAQQDDVVNRVVPYFQGINTVMARNGNFYQVGIYGARNTCSIVSAQGLAALSFVSGMSTGFSGNLGFRLPTNWAFNQILEYTAGTGTGAIAIDKDVQSGRDGGVSSVDSPPAPASLDVQMSSASLQALQVDVANWLEANLNAGQKAIAIRSRAAVAAFLSQYDALFTSLARGYAMRKSLIQTVVMWESACESYTDAGGDAAVIAYYTQKYQGGPPVPDVDDSSTGLGQIFARTAISAINWGRDRGLTALPARDASSYADLWATWQPLHFDEQHNVTMAALVLIEAAVRKAGLSANLLSYGPSEVKAALANYNGAAAYGEHQYGLYQILESYNSTARGVI